MKKKHPMTVEKERRLRYEARHPELVARIKAKKAHAYQIGRRHGMTQADYDQMLRAQRGRCAICLRKPSDIGQRHLCIDHCHATHRTRGLLCNGCNLLLGTIKEDPLRAVAMAQYAGLVPYIIDRCIPTKQAG